MLLDVKKIAKEIVTRGGNYVLCVKNNQFDILMDAQNSDGKGCEKLLTDTV